MAPRPGSTRTPLVALAAASALLLAGCGDKASEGAKAPAPVSIAGHASGEVLGANGFTPAKGTGASWRPAPRRSGRTQQVATVRGTHLLLHTASGDKDFLPGVNLGSTTPGHAPGELAITAADYRRWFPLMAAMGLRAIRIYTIHPPAFYRELVAYNRAHPDAPLYLLQGVYLPDESYTDENRTLFDTQVTKAFRDELRDVSAAVHGDLRRSPRAGRASGTWTADASPWVAAWLVGVEFDPTATARTNRRNAGTAAVAGTYFRSTRTASPAERWLAARMDELAGHETARGSSAPIAFTNWPTTDPLRHPDEPLAQEDLVGLDANHIVPTSRWSAGTFASYHAYPYYPDFLRHEKALRRTLVNGKPDAYAGYLAALARHHAKLPVMISEFGVPSSLGSAHAGTNGRDQGAHTEQEAMAIDAGLMRVIRGQGLAGGLVFSWTDEWFKRTWNTEPRQLPAERRQLWHDPLTNEQWFGLLASDPHGSEDGRARSILHSASGPVRDVTVAHDEAWVTIEATLADDAEGPVAFGFDVVPGGLARLPGVTAKVAAVTDHAVVVDGDRAQVSARADLDPTKLDAAWRPGERAAPVAGWTPLCLTTNRSYDLPGGAGRQRAEFMDVGRLREGSWDPAAPGYRSDATWQRAGRTLRLRLPWSALGLSDPSSRKAFLPKGRTATTVDVPRVGLDIVAGGTPVHTPGFSWEPWQRTFSQPRVKAGIQALVDAVADVTP
jgi:hypothetical protein